MINKISKNYNLIFYLLFFACVAILAAFFPPSAIDDVAWSTSYGKEMLANGFQNYNGRYLGNTCAILITRVPVLLPFIKGATLTGILILIQKISENRSKEFLLLSALLLIIPSPLFVQDFVWTAGFSNYYISVLISMANLYLLFKKTELSQNKLILKNIFLVIFGIAGQLFMETFSVFSVLVSLCAFVFFCRKKRKADISSLLYFFATIIGAIIMFSNGAYMKILKGGDSYRSFDIANESFLKTVFSWIEKLFGEVSFDFIIACFPAVIAVVILSFLILKKENLLENKIKKLIKMFFILSAAASIIFALITYFKTKNYERIYPAAGILLLPVILMFFTITLNIKCKAKRNKLLCYFAMLLIQTAPFVIISPVGPRCFSGVYIILILIIKELFDEIEIKKFAFNNALKFSLCFVIILNLFCYSQAFISHNKKIEFIRSEVKNGNYNIVLDHTDFGFMVYGIDYEAEHDIFKLPFCEYYKFPKEIEITYRR